LIKLQIQALLQSVPNYTIIHALIISACEKTNITQGSVVC